MISSKPSILKKNKKMEWKKEVGIGQWSMVNGQFNLLQILAECRNATHSAFKPKNEDK
ncbi:hypothetical protein [Arenibacter algicola]|uniref:Uncharacterized protein n=1 Tax=Arenibacter algicola TaxID=616991 RepID=A0A221UW08_9FLAO|nr:hypothetical protein [Arenibacter algicola]ASO05286.1 hypothetical protein AREALGSMS7_01822 [Arenibacter algicola]|tara:strand:- start:60804 stop:60977 length:174 start_codon:yes stop_codon:yes gene_type:complete